MRRGERGDDTRFGCWLIFGASARACVWRAGAAMRAAVDFWTIRPAAPTSRPRQSRLRDLAGNTRGSAPARHRPQCRGGAPSHGAERRRETYPRRAAAATHGLHSTCARASLRSCSGRPEVEGKTRRFLRRHLCRSLRASSCLVSRSARSVGRGSGRGEGRALRHSRPGSLVPLPPRFAGRGGLQPSVQKSAGSARFASRPCPVPVRAARETESLEITTSDRFKPACHPPPVSARRATAQEHRVRLLAGPSGV